MLTEKNYLSIVFLLLFQPKTSLMNNATKPHLLLLLYLLNKRHTLIPVFQASLFYRVSVIPIITSPTSCTGSLKLLHSVARLPILCSLVSLDNCFTNCNVSVTTVFTNISTFSSYPSFYTPILLLTIPIFCLQNFFLLATKTRHISLSQPSSLIF